MYSFFFNVLIKIVKEMICLAVCTDDAWQQWPPQVMRVVEGPRTDPGEILYDRALDHSDKCETKTRPDTEPQ